MRSLLSNCGRLLGFSKKGVVPKAMPNPDQLNLQQLPILSASELIQACGYAPDLPELFRLVGVQEQHFDNLYRDSLYAFAEAVQLAPASESHHHAGPGGLLKHTLEVVHSALQLRKAYQLPRRGEPEDIVAQEHAWTFGVFAAALLHDAGKVMSRSPLMLTMADGTERTWNPHDRPLNEIAPASYRIDFRRAEYKAHNRYALTLFGVLLPSVARGWLTNYPHILSQLVAYLWGDEFESGDIGQIVVRADRDSTARNLGSSPDALRFPDAKASTADQLMSGLRQLLGEKDIKLNQNGGMGWIYDDYAYFVCKPLAEKLQSHLASQSVTGIPTETSRLYDVLQEGGFALSTSDGQAIWNVSVQGEGYQHAFTCLKFEARRLFSHNRELPKFVGLITETDSTIETPKTQTPVQPAIISASEHIQETVPASPVVIPKDIPATDSIPTSSAASPVTMPAPKPSSAPAPREAVPVSPLAAIQAKRQNESVPIAENTVATIPPPKPESVPTQEAEGSHVNTEVPIAMPASPVAMSRAAPAQPESVTPVIAQPVREPAISAKIVQPETVVTAETVPAKSQMNDDTGEQFFQWVKGGIHNKKLQVNNGKAPIHFVDEGVFLISPIIFKMFCAEHDNLKESDFNKLQKRLARMNKHIKGKLTNKNIVTYTGKRAGGKEVKLNGMLLPYSTMFEDDATRPETNKFLAASENN